MNRREFVISTSASADFGYFCLRACYGIAHQFRVRDDGRGIDQAVLSGAASEGHYGLRGIRERATQIGGTLTIWSETKAGSELELRVPGSTAHATDRRRSWLVQWAAKA